MAKFAVANTFPPGHREDPFREVMETVHYGLARLGHDSLLTTLAAPRLDPSRRYIVFGSNVHPELPHPAGCIIYNLEQIFPGSPWLGPALLELYRAHRVWDYSQRNVSALRTLGVDARHVPIGFVPELARIPRGAEEVDVLFCGVLNERRLALIGALSAQGLRVEAHACSYGPERDARIARSKIVLNVHYYSAQILEMARISYALANSVAVVSEDGDPDGERPFRTERREERPVAFSAYGDLVAECVALAHDDVARVALARRGFEVFSRLAETEYLGRALELEL